MTHTVTRLLPEAFERLAAIKTKYPDMKHTALVGELLKESVTLTPFDNVKGVAEGSKAIRITTDQLELLKATVRSSRLLNDSGVKRKGPSISG